MHLEPSEDTKKSNLEYNISAIVLIGLSVVYLYLLLSPSQKHLSKVPKHYVIRPDTKVDFEKFMIEFKQAQSGYASWNWNQNTTSYDDIYSQYSEWGKKGHADDFFLNPYQEYYSENTSSQYIPIVPSSKFRCKADSWITMRSELNYKYLWMHQENLWMSATATMDTPLHLRAFELYPVNSSCQDGWVRLREGDSQGFIFMVPPSKEFASDEWTVQIGTSDLEATLNDTRYHFLFEEEGFLINRGTLSCLNVMAQAEYTVRGHTGGWDRTQPSGREFGAMMNFQFINASHISKAKAVEAEEVRLAREQDERDVQEIASFPPSPEKRVISFGLYGGKEKYTTGAVRNAQLAASYFPGWTCRFYVTSDVPNRTIETLQSLGSEIFPIPPGMGYASGMFWRFLVASDQTVDRYIIRDVDSRLNARDRFAVEEWIRSGFPIHILRDHINHCIPMNGGMWGGTKEALPSMQQRVQGWSGRDEYMADLHFLETQIWPDIKHKQFAHDSYCCDRYPNTHPFPRKRPQTYQHVGQVFDSQDRPRLGDIDGFIRGVPVPGSCRKQPDWIYG